MKKPTRIANNVASYKFTICCCNIAHLMTTDMLYKYRWATHVDKGGSIKLYLDSTVELQVDALHLRDGAIVESYPLDQRVIVVVIR